MTGKSSSAQAEAEAVAAQAWETAETTSTAAAPGLGSYVPWSIMWGLVVLGALLRAWAERERPPEAERR